MRLAAMKANATTRQRNQIQADRSPLRLESHELGAPGQESAFGTAVNALAEYRLGVAVSLIVLCLFGGVPSVGNASSPRDNAGEDQVLSDSLTVTDLRATDTAGVVASQEASDDPAHSVAYEVSGGSYELGYAEPEVTNADLDAPSESTIEDVYDEITVVGTHIRDIAPGSSPVIVLDREVIASTGLSTVDQLMEALPQNFGGGATVDTNTALPNDLDAAGNTSRATTVNLRGLGAGSTLVLLNGRRLAPTVGSAFVDISVIPLTAIERVEVLTDGASAIYGSDAIAGVVNFVLRDDYDGVETVLRYGRVSEGSLDERKAAVTLGRSWAGGNALVSYEYFDQDGLPAADRDFAQSASLPLEFDLLPDLKRHGLLISANQELSDKLSVYVDGLYTNRETSSLSQSSIFALNIGSDSEQQNIALGGAYDLNGNWLAQLGISYGKDTTTISSEFVLFPGLTEIEFENTLVTAEAKVDGALFDLPGGTARLAAGINYREEDFDRANITSGDVFTLDRDVFAIFGEVFLPIVSDVNARPGIARLELSIAGRFDDYSDIGSSTNPKIGALWSPGAGLNIRGTYSTSFKAPTLADLDDGVFGAFLANVPDPNAADGTTLILALDGLRGGLSPEESTAWTVGIDYEPDFARDWKFSVTYYDIEFEDRINIPTTNATIPVTQPDVFGGILTFNPSPDEIDEILNNLTLFQDFTIFPGFGPPDIPQNTEAIVDNTLQNIAATNTNGLDVSLSYSRQTEAGQISFDFNGNYILALEDSISTGAPFVENVNTIFNPAELRFRVGGRWSNNGFAASVFVNHTGSYEDNQSVPAIDIDSWTTVDLTLGYDTQDRFGSPMLDDLQLTLSIQNLFDEDPPAISATAPLFNLLGYDPANANPLNRFVAVQLRKGF